MITVWHIIVSTPLTVITEVNHRTVCWHQITMLARGYKNSSFPITFTESSLELAYLAKGFTLSWSSWYEVTVHFIRNSCNPVHSCYRPISQSCGGSSTAIKSCKSNKRFSYYLYQTSEWGKMWSQAHWTQLLMLNRRRRVFQKCLSPGIFMHESKRKKTKKQKTASKRQSWRLKQL